MEKVKTIVSYIVLCLAGLVLLIACGTAERGVFEKLRFKNNRWRWGAKKGTPSGWHGSCKGNWGSRATMGIGNSTAVFDKLNICIIQTIRPSTNVELGG